MKLDVTRRHLSGISPSTAGVESPTFGQLKSLGRMSTEISSQWLAGMTKQKLSRRLRDGLRRCPSYFFPRRPTSSGSQRKKLLSVVAVSATGQGPACRWHRERSSLRCGLVRSFTSGCSPLRAADVKVTVTNATSVVRPLYPCSYSISGLGCTEAVCKLRWFHPAAILPLRDSQLQSREF